MRNFAQIRCRQWEVTGTSRLSRMLAIYLLSCPASNMIGLYRLKMVVVMEDLFATREEVLAAFKELEGWASYDADEDLVLVHEAVQLNFSRMPNPKDKRVRAIPKLIPDSDSPLIEKFMQMNKPLVSPFEAPSKPLAVSSEPVDIKEKGDAPLMGLPSPSPFPLPFPSSFGGESPPRARPAYPYERPLEEQFGTGAGGAAEELLAYFNQAGNTRYPFNTWRCELVGTVRDFPMEDLKRVIDYCSEDSWRFDNRGRDWFTIRRLFGDKRKTGELVEQSRTTAKKNDFWEVG